MRMDAEELGIEAAGVVPREEARPASVHRSRLSVSEAQESPLEPPERVPSLSDAFSAKMSGKSLQERSPCRAEENSSLGANVSLMTPLGLSSSRPARSEARSSIRRRVILSDDDSGDDTAEHIGGVDARPASEARPRLSMPQPQEPPLEPPERGTSLLDAVSLKNSDKSLRDRLPCRADENSPLGVNVSLMTPLGLSSSRPARSEARSSIRRRVILSDDDSGDDTAEHIGGVDARPASEARPRLSMPQPQESPLEPPERGTSLLDAVSLKNSDKSLRDRLPCRADENSPLGVNVSLMTPLGLSSSRPARSEARSSIRRRVILSDDDSGDDIPWMVPETPCLASLSKEAAGAFDRKQRRAVEESDESEEDNNEENGTSAESESDLSDFIVADSDDFSSSDDVEVIEHDDTTLKGRTHGSTLGRSTPRTKDKWKCEECIDLTDDRKIKQNVGSGRGRQISQASTPGNSWARTQKILREMVPQLFADYNARVFEDRLPANLSIEWNSKLQRTAGYCSFSSSGGQRKARIDLSSKVLDSPERLANTLAHELCHAAQWLLDGASKPPHGPAFWKYANIFSKRVDGIHVSTCHSYDIFYRFRYECSACGYNFGRQSKSIDLERQRCGKCRGSLRLLGAFNRDGTPAKTREPSAFAKFLKENFSAVKASRPAASHRELMAALGQSWRESKLGSVASHAVDEDSLNSSIRLLSLE